jgi:hypothetical protein
MKAWWISALVGGRTLPSVLRAPFFVFRVKVCRGGAQVGSGASCNKVFPASTPSQRYHRETCGSGEVFVDFVWLWGSSDRQGVSSAVFLLIRPRDGCGLLDPFGDFPSATNNIRPTQEGATAVARR